MRISENLKKIRKGKIVSIIFNNHSNWGDFTSYGDRLFFKENSFVYKKGEIGKGIYYIEKGLVKATSVNTKGEGILVNISLPQQLIGVQAMDQVAHFSSTEIIKDSVLYFFSCEVVNEIIHKHPHAHRLLLGTIKSQMRCLIDTIYLNNLPSEKQLARLILNIYEDFKQFKIFLSQKDLIKCTGLTRVTIYKVMKNWREKGYIETMSNSLIIKNVSALRSLADSYS